jgi:Protein of unknown function (DUF1552)/Protein of unknown function (DUF1588)/Protein of unknown function (DUF1592)
MLVLPWQARWWTRAKVREFLLQWLKVDRASDVSKVPKVFPQFSPVIASDLRTSLDLFLEDAVWGESSDFRRLLLADEIYLNGRLAQFYGAKLPAAASFQKVKLDEQERAGLLTHPYLTAALAYTATSSPIHRGVFLSRGVLGRALSAPPTAVAPLAPDLHAGLTARERVSLQTSPKSCEMCHTMINSLGYTIEHFDAVGRFRKDEKGKPIDATGTYQTRSGDTVTFTGARSLATYLAGSDETHSAFVQQLFHYLGKLRSAFSTEDRQLLEEHATFVREMEQELKEAGKDPIGHAVPEIEPGVKEENDNIPRISKMQIELRVRSFAADFARIATLQYTNSVGGAKMHWIGVSEGHHELSHHPDSNKESVDKLTKINEWFCEQRKAPLAIVSPAL